MLFIFLGSISTVSAKLKASSNATNNSTTYDVASYVNEMLDYNYTNVSKGYKAPVYTGEPLEIRVDQAFLSGTASITENNYNYMNPVIEMELGDVASLEVEVPETAQYFLRFEYLSYSNSILPIELSMKVDGEHPFYETRRLIFESTWIPKAEKSYDRYNNEIVTIPDKLIQWESKYLMDASYRHSRPLILELEKGSHTFEFTLTEGTVLLGNLYLEPVKSIDEYTGSEIAKGNQIITIEAEDFTYRNDSSIRAVAEFDTDITPYEIKETLLNTIDQDSFKDAGQRVTYEFTVKEAGNYYIALNYRQSEKQDFPVFVDVAIDGKIPSTAFASYPLQYVSSFNVETLEDNQGDYLSVYLDEGVHTISFTINIENIRHVLEGVERINSQINDLSLEITKVAGNNKDKYRDLKLASYIPDIQERIYGWADTLDDLHNSVKKYNPNVKNIAVFSQAEVASEQLRSLGEEPNEIPYRNGELVTSSNSVTACLANLLDSLSRNKLAIDRIFIYQEEASLPKDMNFISKMFMNFKRFISSFFDQAYSTSNVDEDHIQVWVNRPRQYLEIMQKMIDEQFTPNTGIEVDLSLMPDQYKLILANSSGDAPDIATGINYAQPFELAIRGALKDLTEFEDFSEIAYRYGLGMHIPAVIGDGIYALPETMNFWVLYYRSDILNKLNLEVPDTIDDVIDMLPELQMRGLNFYYPTAGMASFRHFHGTIPLLYQHGASLYSKNAGDTTINSEAAIKGLTKLTELFTIYNIPVDIPNFYQHFRNGDLPIGIADYGIYNLLINAAPEIANSWEIAPVPGVMNEQGEVLRYTCGGAESTVMFKSDSYREKQAWEFMKWWSSAEVQSEFGQTLQISFGDEYIWNSANLEAFQALPWDSKDKQIIADQAKWVMEPPRILGTYMLERELSNAFNDIVVNGETLRLRIDKAVKIINRETERKLEEFGYIKDGKVIKEYEVPSLETVKRILGDLD